MSGLRPLLLLMLTPLLWSGCRKADVFDIGPVAADEFRVMTYNVERYNIEDRDGDGVANDPKPEAERERVVELITKVSPDVLALQEIGRPAVFKELTYNLKLKGLDYPYSEYMQLRDSELNLAVLSRFPIVAFKHHHSDVYSIGSAKIPVLRGFLQVDIEAPNHTRFRLINAHLKSKVFHRLGQTEMRRNEARLLHNHVKDSLEEHPERLLLVVGDLNDHIASAALREVIGKKDPKLHDLRPVDAASTAWTYADKDIDTYQRIDYILASEAMLRHYKPDRIGSLIVPGILEASDHRPIFATFTTHPGTHAPAK